MFFKQWLLFLLQNKKIIIGTYSTKLELVLTRAFYFRQNTGNGKEAGHIQLEQEVLAPLAGTGKLFAFQISNWWSQAKTAGSAIYANRNYLELYRTRKPERLVKQQLDESGDSNFHCEIIPDVYIHSSAIVDSTALLGPNVSIGPNVHIGAGVRIRESIILEGAVIQDHSLILYSIVGRDSKIGEWARVEGTPGDPDPNKPFAKMENPPLFNNDGRLNPSITILGNLKAYFTLARSRSINIILYNIKNIFVLGCGVTVPSETILLNSIVLPHKDLSRSFKNEIIL